jgi:hypothetical protein
MCCSKRQQKPTCYDEVGRAMMRAAATCFAVVVCLSYDTQVVEYNAPTTPKTCGTSPHFFAMKK